MRSTARRVAPFLVVLSLVLAAPRSRVAAWGPSGHRIVALVAAKHLTPHARQQVATILGNQTLADVANWADEVRQERPTTAPWHFVNLPRTATSFSRTRDCRDSADGSPGCAVTAIEHFRDVLKGTAAGDRTEALKFIVHFVGDLHQPLHVSFEDDRGGNDIHVKFFGKASNLHRTWDSGIIGHAGLSDDEFAAELESELNGASGEEEFAELSPATQKKIAQIQAGTLDGWATESFKLARSNAYDHVPRNGSARLAQPYYDRNAPVVDQQLLKGGLRLAKILNDIFG